jgi:hypothetical protein
MSRGVLAAISTFAIGILVVVAGFFLLGVEKTAINYWAFGSLLFSLVVSLLVTLTLVAPKGHRGGVFYAAGLSGTVWIYEIAVVISVLFVKAFTDRVNGFIFLQIAINALFLVVAIIIVAVSSHVYDSNASTYEKLQNGEYNKPKRGGF